MRCSSAIALVFCTLGWLLPTTGQSAEPKTVVVVEKTIATVVTVEPIFIFVDCNGKEMVAADKGNAHCSVTEKKMYKYVVSLPNKQTLGYITPQVYSVGATLIAEKNDQGNWIIH